MERTDIEESKASRREVFGWAMYDWANSAYVTTAAVAVLPAYFVSAVVPKEGYAVGGVLIGAGSLWGYILSLSALVSFVFAPVLGAVADHNASKKYWLMLFTAAGSLATFLLYFSGPGEVWTTLVLFGLSQVFFIGGNVFYDAFLPHIASPERLDRVSGLGYAYGYVGGGLHFALALGLMLLKDRLGLTEEHAARIAVATSGLWWALFTVPAFLWLREKGRPAPLPETLRRESRLVAALRLGVGRMTETVRAARRDRDLLLFFVAYFFYNDGIHTVINMATIYGTEELGLATSGLMLTLLIIQAVAFGGALAFGRLAERIAPKPALLASLAVWTLVTAYAWFLRTQTEFFVLGVLVGLALGGSQALSRSIFAALIPPQDSAQYFGYFSVMTKLSAILGPLVFAVVRQAAGSARPAVLSLAVFFIVGMFFLARARVGHKARPA